MGIVRSRLGVCGTVIAIGLLAASTASAEEGEIKFCNDFPHMVYVAIAYEQVSGQYISRGWISIDTGDCSYFDTAIRVDTFYYHAESYWKERRRSYTETWGAKDNQFRFAVKTSSNFQYWNASERVLDSRLVGFSKGPQSTDGPVTATITFNADETVTTSVPGQASAPSNGGGGTGSGATFGPGGMEPPSGGGAGGPGNESIAPPLGPSGN